MHTARDVMFRMAPECAALRTGLPKVAIASSTTPSFLNGGSSFYLKMIVEQTFFKVRVLWGLACSKGAWYTFNPFNAQILGEDNLIPPYLGFFSLPLLSLWRRP
jgi:hypothetical protein